MKRNGFTLIELLVVVAIIIILSTIGLTVYGETQKNARDARRKGDVTAVSEALEARYSNGVYPTSINSSGDWFVGPTPADPKDSSSYVVGTLDGTGYKLCATLERGVGGNYDNSGNIKTANGPKFCLTSRQ